MGNEGEGHSAFLVQGKPVSFICKHKKIWHISRIKLLFCVLFLFFSFLGVECYAQSSMRKKAVENKDSIMPLSLDGHLKQMLSSGLYYYLMLLPNSICSALLTNTTH